METNINKLLFNNKPKSVLQAQALLDANGYKGRAKVKPVREHGVETTKIEVEIHLSKSNFTYTYPLENSYNLTTSRLETKCKVDYSKGLPNAFRIFPMEELIFWDKTNNARLICNLIDFGSMTYLTAKRYVLELTKLGFIVNEKLKVHDRDEIEEVIGNLFDKDSRYLIEPF